MESDNGNWRHKTTAVQFVVHEFPFQVALQKNSLNSFGHSCIPPNPLNEWTVQIKNFCIDSLREIINVSSAINNRIVALGSI